MENIQVGEYIRTKQGYIHIVKSVHKDMIWWCDLDWIPEKDIVKHSKDIIDLIKVGDFINGKMCIDIEHYTRDDGSNGIDFVCIGGSVLKENIKSIVTNEQFNSIKYEVER